ncbi:ExbD/TolR family protein [Alkalilimnicola ehrlichii MLHE-1]|uniref:Outer membrane transport energization protein ExbD n=1 Tax=Alkalilimnicola ehrlichii (strain ATCC BAA-1101 / DSM 17681 / MLHE-1) TaxID=187272 RepID=Q0A7J6_ALKEH|nr:biopolymer transporter ExbD [Alkalilimnicola ehrlichii]ABI57191.1 outer membrane transport energization protein ExbD [Alkalilimnicola ehrlichii MLHE-1]
MQLEQRRKRRRLVSLTPLIDVVFILLIFFMLATTFAQWRAVPVSAAGEGGDAVAELTALRVSVDADGRFRMEGQAVDLSVLKQRVRDGLTADPDRPVRLQTHDDAPLRAVVAAMDGIRAAGGHNLSLARE